MALGQQNADMDKKPQDSESRHADKYIVRFPDGMRDRLKAAGQAAGRSLNAEIVYRLEQSFRLEAAGLLSPLVAESLQAYGSGDRAARLQEMLEAVRKVEAGIVALQRTPEK
tara:strand:- start:840 stop:1175 length:336 start_codon:yes stop_codon:yes gene_type:complete